MKKTITAIFQSSEAAEQGLTTLNNNNRTYKSKVKNLALVDKSASTIADFKDLRKNKIKNASLLGLGTGAILGLLSSLEDMISGAFIGLLAGMLYDYDQLQHNDTLLNNTAGILAPGEVAIIVEVKADNETNIYEIFEALKASVYQEQKYELIKWIN